MSKAAPASVNPIRDMVIRPNPEDSEFSHWLTRQLANDGYRVWCAKFNCNTCIFGDGMPISLKFADAIGEIPTAGATKDVPPLPFGHYI
jgi:hypothetical protein